MDLRAAVRDFTDLGFTVGWGADPAKAHNALIWFDEGPFIELSHVPRWVGSVHLPMRLVKGRAVADRFRAWARSTPGFHDLALETDAVGLADAHAALRAAGIATSKVLAGRRTRPDGEVVRYEFLLPESVALPFVVSAYQPVQRPRQTVHANGATGIAAIDLDVATADEEPLRALAGGDRWLRLTPASSTAVRAVRLHGLTGAIDPNGTRPHGGVYLPA